MQIERIENLIEELSNSGSTISFLEAKKRLEDFSTSEKEDFEHTEWWLFA